MKEITFMICSNGMKESVTYPDDLLLGTVIRECADHGIITQNSQYLITKEDDRALNMNVSLADNGIVDGDVLYVGSVTKAGADNEDITVTFWLNSLSHEIPTVSSIQLGDLLSQISGELGSTGPYEAVKKESSKALDQRKTLKDLGIGDGDEIELGAITKAGC